MRRHKPALRGAGALATVAAALTSLCGGCTGKLPGLTFDSSHVWIDDSDRIVVSSFGRWLDSPVGALVSARLDESLNPTWAVVEVPPQRGEGGRLLLTEERGRPAWLAFIPSAGPQACPWFQPFGADPLSSAPLLSRAIEVDCTPATNHDSLSAALGWRDSSGNFRGVLTFRAEAGSLIPPSLLALGGDGGSEEAGSTESAMLAGVEPIVITRSDGRSGVVAVSSTGGLLIYLATATGISSRSLAVPSPSRITGLASTTESAGSVEWSLVFVAHESGLIERLRFHDDEDLDSAASWTDWRTVQPPLVPNLMRAGRGGLWSFTQTLADDGMRADHLWEFIPASGDVRRSLVRDAPLPGARWTFEGPEPEWTVASNGDLVRASIDGLGSHAEEAEGWLRVTRCTPEVTCSRSEHRRHLGLLPPPER